MTNSSKKTVSVSRDNFDLDLDARLDKATSTLKLDDEPPAGGDALDQLLARAKKEIDAHLPEELTPEELSTLDTNLDDDFDLDELLGENIKLDADKLAISSQSITALESQLAAAMDSTSAASDTELDNLLGGAGFDFDSLLGEAVSDELKVEKPVEPEIEPIIAESEIEPEIEPEREIEPVIAESKIEPEIEPEREIEPVIAESEIEPEIEPEREIEPIIAESEIEPEIEPEREIEPVIAESEIEPEIEPEFDDDLLMTAVDELLHLGVSKDEIEAVIEPQKTNLEPEIELTVEPDAALDDLVDSVPFEDTLKVESDEIEIDNFAEEFNDFDEVADSVAPLVEISTSDESFEDDLNAMQQLEDGLNEAMENKNDKKSAGFDLLDDDATGKESATPVLDSADDDDWMKQLDDLDDVETEKSSAVSLDKAESDGVVADEDDWMKQLDDLDDAETEKAPAVSLDKTESDDVVADEDDWMKQLDGLDADENVSKEVGASEDDWMSQLEGLEEHDEDTANLLMDAGHDHNEDKIVDNNNFNITDEPDVNIEKPEMRAIDEEALIAKAADLAISQFKDEFKDDQEHIMSQLRADQDTIESRNKKQFSETETKQKKNATFGYIALGVGVIGLLGSAGIGWLSYGTKGQTEVLSQSVTTLEEKVEDILAKSPEKEKEIANIKTSVEQLSQKVEKIAAAQVAVPVPAVATTAPEHGAAVPHVETDKGHSPAALLSKVAPEITPPKSTEAKPDEKVIDEAKTADVTKTADIAKKAAETAKAEAAKLAKIEAEKTAKAEAHLLSEKIAKATAVAKAAAASTKTDEQRKSLTEKATRYTGRMTRGMARGVAKDKSETAKTKVATKKEILNTNVATQKAVPAGKYSVNVVSYQQEWFAQSKAAEFKQKGIPVEVVPVDASKVGTHYRLKVAGFKNKAEAAAYADKIKKSHNLGETWIGTN
jgi:hypothetical protein